MKMNFTPLFMQNGGNSSKGHLESKSDEDSEM